MAYIMTLTQAGLSYIVNVQAGTIGPLEITEIGLTDAYFTVASTLEELPGEFKRLDVAGDTLGDDLIHLNALDDSADAYAYRGFALYSSTGVLFAAYGQAEIIAEKTAGTQNFISLDIAMASGQSDAITFGDTNFLNPPATTTQQGVVELATDAEAQAGTDRLRVITPASAKAAVLSWIGFVPLAASAFTNSAILSLLGYVPFDSAGFTGAAIKAVLGYDPQDAADFSTGSNANGYWRRMPDGLIEQWGEVTAGESSSPPSLNFPIAFTDLASINLQVTARNPNIASTNGNKVGGNKVSVTQFNVFSDDLDMAVFWRAIGR